MHPNLTQQQAWSWSRHQHSPSSAVVTQWKRQQAACHNHCHSPHRSLPYQLTTNLALLPTSCLVVLSSPTSQYLPPHLLICRSVVDSVNHASAHAAAELIGQQQQEEKEGEADRMLGVLIKHVDILHAVNRRMMEERSRERAEAEASRSDEEKNRERIENDDKEERERREKEDKKRDDDKAAVQKQLNEKVEELEREQLKTSALHATNISLGSHIQRLQTTTQQLQATEQQLRQSTLPLAVYNKAIAAAQSQLASLRQQLDASRQLQSASGKELEQLKQTQQQTERQCAELRKQVQTAQAQTKVSQMELDNATTRHRELVQQHEAQTKQLGQSAAQLTASQQANEQLSTKLGSATTELTLTKQQLTTERGQWEAEVKELKARRIPRCSICMDALSDALLQPCCHVSCCVECAEELKENNLSCPRCDRKIRSVIAVTR